jgi:hypothetical protein
MLIDRLDPFELLYSRNLFLFVFVADALGFDCFAAAVVVVVVAVVVIEPLKLLVAFCLLEIEFVRL